MYFKLQKFIVFHEKLMKLKITIKNNNKYLDHYENAELQILLTYSVHSTDQHCTLYSSLVSMHHHLYCQISVFHKQKASENTDLIIIDKSSKNKRKKSVNIYNKHKQISYSQNILYLFLYDFQITVLWLRNDQNTIVSTEILA